jgi:midasin (ATPase involved in ribosome maturation)
MTDEIAKLDLQAVQMSIKSLISDLRERANLNTTMQQRSLHSDNTTSMKEPNLSYDGHLSKFLITSLVALLNQFIGLADSYLVNLLSAHRTTCKLLSVLLGMFTELAEKGFCLPPEMEEEESGEGATEFEDIEDGGLGEGEGAKDVSDQIENEDQVK